MPGEPAGRVAPGGGGRSRAGCGGVVMTRGEVVRELTEAEIELVMRRSAIKQEETKRKVIWYEVRQAIKNRPELPSDLTALAATLTFSDLDCDELRELREMAEADFVAGDAGAMLGKSSNDFGLRIVLDNLWQLKARGIYEAGLIPAYSGCRLNWAGWSLEALGALFQFGDRAKLLEAGDPLPDGDTFTLYRGVYGLEPYRKMRGMSWTSSYRTAVWFAERYREDGASNIAVYRARVPRSDIYAYLDAEHRNEEDFIVLARRCRRLPTPTSQDVKAANDWQAEENMKALSQAVSAGKRRRAT